MAKTAYEQRKAWLRNLKLGDNVALPRSTTGADRAHDLVPIERVTATQFIVRKADGTEVHIRRKDGDVVGNRVLFVREPDTVRVGA
jgi:hypothetical protein